MALYARRYHHRSPDRRAEKRKLSANPRPSSHRLGALSVHTRGLGCTYCQTRIP